VKIEITYFGLPFNLRYLK